MRIARILAAVVVMVTVGFLVTYGAGGLKPGEGYVEVPGGRVWYRVVGEGTGTPLLVLHGGSGVPSYYLKPLAGIGVDRPVVFYDQLGCGHSDKISDTSLFTIDHYLKELAAVRRALGLNEVDIYGHSWGAMLAVDYMLTKPDGVRALVLASPSLDMERWVRDADSLLTTLPDSVQEVITEHEEAGTTDAPEYQQAMMLFYQMYLARKQPWSADIDSSFAQMNPQIYQYMFGPSEFTITGTMRTYNRDDRLGEITVPTLFTAGEFDEARPSTVKYFQSLMPGSKLEIFPGCGHLTMQDDSASYVDSLRKFLRTADETQ
ncbi:MAG: proline iminopeptidase-family hydrolase [Candidatus Zixiibacteriota bacterium]|jgi:proline iminopeptidase